jgi:ATP-dependent helicase HrpB
VPEPLPIDPHVSGIVAEVRAHRAAVIAAAPGAGKTTRVPPALAADGPVIVLQPRRVAARTIARRIADEQGWSIGREVGWHVRFERQYGRETRVLLATEGVLTARLQQDPLLSGFRTIVLDEFHERSIHADLGIALARQAWAARDDLQVVVMSATLDVARVARYLGGCPVVEVPGRVHPIDVRYAPEATLTQAVDEALRASPGQVLCFLPGAPEIRRAHAELDAGMRGRGVELVALHGSLTAQEQDAAIAPVDHRRVILATNVAETSLTVPDVTAVIDSGLQKIARYDPDRAIDSLETERVSQDAADQRAGRAGRQAPGVAWRLWNAADRLRPHREPDIARIDLSGPVLDVLVWGGDPRALDWFEPPPPDALESALALLARLGAVDGGRVTDLGRDMQRLRIHPRLARILLAAGGAEDAALACAVLSERHFLPPRGETTSSDLLAAIERRRDLPAHVLRVARELAGGQAGPALDEREFRRALLAGYPDRVGRRRAAESPRVLLTSGHGAVVDEQSGVRGGEFLVAVDVTAGRRGAASEARIRLASVVDREWLSPTHTAVEHHFDESRGIVRATEREYYGAIVLGERPRAPGPLEASRLLADAYLARPLADADERLVRRLRFSGVPVDVDALARQAALGKRSLREMDLAAVLPWDVRQNLERLAPERIEVPSGRSAAIEYHADGTVSAEVKLQELFGLAETPRIGARGEPVLLSLLAPNGRPVQMTRDLRSFWDRTYPEIRKALRGRYPKHPWPEDPWTAQPTARPNRRSG